MYARVVDLFYYFHISERPIGSRSVQMMLAWHVAWIAICMDAAGRRNLDLQESYINFASID